MKGSVIGGRALSTKTELPGRIKQVSDNVDGLSTGLAGDGIHTSGAGR